MQESFFCIERLHIASTIRKSMMDGPVPGHLKLCGSSKMKIESKLDRNKYLLSNSGLDTDRKLSRNHGDPICPEGVNGIVLKVHEN